MQWPQPISLTSSTLKANDKAKVINRIEDAIKHCARTSLRALKLRLLLIVILTIQVFGTMIASALRWKQPPWTRKQMSSRWWRYGIKALTRVANGVGDWIERVVASPLQTRRRRILRTVTRHRYTTKIMAMSVLAMQANATISTERESRFDTDSGLVGIDNRCSACISHEPSDFDGPLEKSNRVVKGFGGSRTTNIKVGTLKWSWEDDQGAITTFRIPNSYYVPEGKVRLLSPQHWAQTQTTTRNKVRSRGCSEHTDGDRCVLTWHDGMSQRTINAETVARRFRCGIETAQKTLKATTQRGVRQSLHPLNHCYRVDHLNLNRKRLNDTFYMDTLFLK
ncbi:hypothetical protein MHU86_17395 [Fragilaria crotonensis]|nr:hypothetical protein MHU86_17395 [Fragilaria crotonensis]